MSAGAGHVMRAIAQAIEIEPVLTVPDLCRRVYPTADRIEKKHRVAVIRSMRALLDTRSDLTIEGGVLYKIAAGQQSASFEEFLQGRGYSDAAQWSHLCGAWNRASPETRARFLQQVNGTNPLTYSGE